MGGRTLESGPPPLTHCVSCRKCHGSPVICNMRCPGLKAGEYLMEVKMLQTSYASQCPCQLYAVCMFSMTRHDLLLSSQQAILQVSDSTLLGEQTEAWT